MISFTLQLITSLALAVAGVIFLVAAIVHERRMQANRKPGVTYAQATLRRDGGWRRRDLFSEAGLRHQRRASLCGITGAALLLGSLLAWIAFGTR